MLTPRPENTPTAVLIFANPYSGRKDNRRRVETLKDALTEANLTCRVVWNAAERTRLLAGSEQLSNCRCLVAAGGDGTVAAVINDLPPQIHPPLAVMPLGGENLFATQLGFNIPPSRLADAIGRGRTHRIDLGLADKRSFALMVSAGLDAQVVHQLAATRGNLAAGALRRMGRSAYLRPLVHAWRHYRYPLLELETDGRILRGAHVFVFNLGLYGPKWRFAPDARPDDGLLDWFVLRKPGKASAARYLAALVRGRLTKRCDVLHGRSEKLHLRAADATEAPVQGDGDPLGHTPVQLQAVRGALNVLDVAIDTG